MSERSGPRRRLDVGGTVRTTTVNDPPEEGGAWSGPRSERRRGISERGGPRRRLDVDGAARTRMVSFCRRKAAPGAARAASGDGA